MSLTSGILLSSMAVNIAPSKNAIGSTAIGWNTMNVFRPNVVAISGAEGLGSSEFICACNSDTQFISGIWETTDSNAHPITVQ